MNARLAGGTTPPLGWYEPVICDPGNYCPINASTKILCPEGYYCRQGSFEPTKCSPGASCPAGSKYDMTLLPLVFLIIIDVALISGVVFKKIRARMARRAEHHKTKPKPTQSPFGPGKGRYAPLGENDGLGMEESDIAMEARITSFKRRATGFEQLHELDAGISIQDHFLQTPQGSKASPGAPEESSDLHLFVQSLSRCLGQNSFGLSFEFENLSFKPPKSEKLILSEVSGNINAGSLWGVMGASGAGKSTFVNVLMGKTAHTGGVTKVNGVPGNISKYRKIIGYVPQDDIVLPELTVRENILHSARIRLPANWTDKEIQHHVDILISCLNLSHVRDSLVGSTAAPVISGGQRKRVSIGMELAAAPMALFLDEPTSGLDATAAASIMSTLKALSRLGMTIVTIIHQPRQEIFESMDSLVLLGAGRMIYIGPEKGIQPHFEGLGFHFPEHSNPADTMGDIIAGEGHLYKKHGDAGISPLIEYWHNKQAASLRDREGVKSPVVSVEEVTNLASTIKLRGAPWYRQIILCLNRSVMQQYRLKSSFFFELGVAALAGFLIGLAELSSHGQNFRGIFHPPYDVLSSSIDYANVPQMALLVGLAIGLTASAPGVKIFGEEKLAYWREAAAGHNRFAYYVGKVLSTLPRMFLACFHFTTLFLLLSTPRIPWINAFGANLLYFWCIYGLASCISMVTRREDGPLLAVMSSLIVGVLNGMSPQLSKVRKWHMVWLWRASPGTWLAEAYFDQNVSPLAYLYQIEQAQKGIGYDLGAFGLDLGLLFAVSFLYPLFFFSFLLFSFHRASECICRVESESRG
jgi:ABC-type multidrug transport system ATPase subunit